MFEERLRQIEGAEACFATGSGMSAVFVALAALLGKGDRVVSSRALFGSCFVILDEILPRWGVETVFVDGADLDQWREALSEPTTAVFFETPSNPMQELVDIAAVTRARPRRRREGRRRQRLRHARSSPSRFELGADIVVYSATKHIDGQGRTLGGAVLGPKEFIDGPVQNLMRHTGPSMSPFNAWVLVKGLETMSLRVERMADSALEVARFLESHPKVTRVVHPFLESHPQHELAKRQMRAGGTVVTFELDGGKDEAFALMNALQVIDISNNLGDSKSLITHPATTTHRRLAPEARAAVGITDGVLRVSVGLEDVRDLVDDLRRALGLTRASAHLAVGRTPPRRALLEVWSTAATVSGRSAGQVSGGGGERQRRGGHDRDRAEGARARDAARVDRQARGAASRGPEQRRDRAPHRDDGSGVDADEQGREPRRRVGHGRLEREVGRQVVDAVGGQHAEAADAEEVGRAGAVPDDGAEPVPRARARRAASMTRKRTQMPMTVSHGILIRRSSSGARQ